MGQDLSYSWHAQSAAPFARLVAVNHDVYARDNTGKVVFNRIQALLNVFAWDSPGTLTVVEGTNPTRLIGSGTYTINYTATDAALCLPEVRVSQGLLTVASP